MKQLDQRYREPADLALGSLLRGSLRTAHPPIGLRDRLMRRAAAERPTFDSGSGWAGDRARASAEMRLDQEHFAFYETIETIRYRYLAGFAKLRLAW